MLGWANFIANPPFTSSSLIIITLACGHKQRQKDLNQQLSHGQRRIIRVRGRGAQRGEAESAQ